MPKVAKFVSLLVVVTAIAFYGHALTQQTRNITWPSLDAASGATLLFSACMLGILGVIGGGVWHVILIDAGLRPKLKDSMSIVLLSSIAKYVPGNVAHHLGKVLLAKEKGWPAPIVIQTMFAENLWNAATAVGFSVFGVVAFLGSSAESALALNSPHLFLPVVFVALWAMPWILSRALSLLPQSISNRFFAGGEPHLPSGRTALIAGCG
ncbi:MAG: lysylphosphatidylglycerol synthase domain-containing protein, partial [Pseudomonadota bacterium]